MHNESCHHPLLLLQSLDFCSSFTFIFLLSLSVFSYVLICLRQETNMSGVSPMVLFSILLELKFSPIYRINNCEITLSLSSLLFSYRSSFLNKKNPILRSLRSRIEAITLKNKCLLFSCRSRKTKQCKNQILSYYVKISETKIKN